MAYRAIAMVLFLTYAQADRGKMDCWVCLGSVTQREYQMDKVCFAVLCCRLSLWTSCSCVFRLPGGCFRLLLCCRTVWKL